MAGTKKRNKLALFWSAFRRRLPLHDDSGSRPENSEKNGERPPAKLRSPEEVEESLACLLESLGHGLEAMKEVEESLTRILDIFVHDLEIMKRKLKEFERN